MTARGVLAVAAAYTYFLLWVQYGFLDLLQARLAGPGPVRLAMAAMGVAGLAASLLAGRLLAPRAGGGRLRRALLPAGFVLAAAAAPAGLAARGGGALGAVAALLGVATALVTVPLAADLRRLLPGRRFGLAVGLGTGIAYLVCNLPPLFEGSPAVQAWFVAGACVLAALAVAGAAERDPATAPAPLLPRRAFRRAGFAAVVAAFLALVWLDSAAFAVIQETAALKGVSWAGASRTLAQGAVHLLAGLAAGAAVDAGLLLLLPAAAFTLFAVALPLLTGGAAAGGGPAALLAAPLYAAGISLYSVALVAYPAARGDEPGLVPRRWRAAALFGVAGWLGSALGVGMAQDLHRVPGGFVAAAGVAMAVAVGLAWGGRRRRASERDGTAVPPAEANRSTRGDGRDSRAAGVHGGAPSGTAPHAEPPARRRAAAALRRLRVLAGPLLFTAAALAWPTAGARDAAPDSASLPLAEGFASRSLLASQAADAVARGRRVYVGEGCVHCHSQYVRPGATDVEPWGPFRPLDRTQRPPLVGNRRQGPDLANVGNRRHPVWQRAHLLDPQALVPGSRMPSYAHLFATGERRGEDLVAYLGSLGAGSGGERLATIDAWPAGPLPAGSEARGGALFRRHCAACHGAHGRGDGPLAAQVRRRGMDLGKGSLWLVTWSDGDPGDLDLQLARLVRFGAAGSPMPGHEWLSLQEVSDVVAFLHTLLGGESAAGAETGPSAAPAQPRAAGFLAGSRRGAGLGGAALLAFVALALTGWLTPPRPWREATGWSRVPPAQRAPVRAEPWPAGTAAGPPPRLTWLGHAGFLVEWEGTRLLLDPNSSPRCTVARRLLAERVDPAGLGPIDAALISHAHYDHLDLPTLAAVPGLAAVAVPAGSEVHLAPLDPAVRRVGLRAGERFRAGTLEVVAVPALHNGNRFHPLASRQAALGYVVRGSRAALFFAGDTGYGPHLAAIGAAWRPRLAILPIGAYAPRWPLRRYHLSPEEAVRAGRDLGAEVVVPAHFGTFPLSLDRPDAALPRFAAAAATDGLPWVLAPLPPAADRPR